MSDGTSEFLGLVGLAALLTMVFASTWQMTAVGGAVCVDIAAIAVFGKSKEP